jgi:HD superfamily phosphodiesterase
MKKKIIAILAVVIAFVVLYAGYQTFLAPKGTEGSKEVTIQIIIEKEEIDKTFTYKTDHEFLTDLLKEKQEELGAIMDSSDYGTMITGMMNYMADVSENEFFLIQINGEDAMVGTDDTPIQDGDSYNFILSTW